MKMLHFAFTLLGVALCALFFCLFEVNFESSRSRGPEGNLFTHKLTGDTLLVVARETVGYDKDETGAYWCRKKTSDRLETVAYFLSELELLPRLGVISAPLLDTIGGQSGH